MREIKSLTGLRGYAALWVCLHHYHYGDYAGELSWYLKLAKQGSWGVIIFFVLSGFIMAYVYQSWFREGCNRREYWHFMFIRFARVYPLHLLTLLLWLGFCVIGFIGYNQNDTAYTFILNLLLLHAWGFTDAISWNQPSWSISTELFCYLVFPVWMLYVRGLEARWLPAALALIMAAILFPPHILLAKAALSQFGRTLDAQRFAYGLSLLSWFLVFALGALWFQAIQSIRVGQISANLAVLAGLVLLSLMVGGADELPPKAIRPIITLASAVLIFGLYHQARLGDWCFGNVFAVFLGNVSYGLYLSHIMTPLVIDQTFMRLGSVQRMTAWPMGVQLIVALAIAALLHHGFEKPARRWIRSRWSVSGGVPA
jgi:peptidoglycan/LPS O-acetylase OafA/YrhL